MEPWIKELIICIAFIIVMFTVGITSQNSFRFLHKIAEDEWERMKKEEEETGEESDSSKWWEIKQEIEKERQREYFVIGAFALFIITAIALT